MLMLASFEKTKGIIPPFSLIDTIILTDYPNDAYIYLYKLPMFFASITTDHLFDAAVHSRQDSIVGMLYVVCLLIPVFYVLSIYIYICLLIPFSYYICLLIPLLLYHRCERVHHYGCTDTHRHRVV
jgi:hypothetical protein